MLIFNQKEKLKAHLASYLVNNNTIGFVPTMGALHLGHIALIRQSLIENDITVVSIFVNPTQFNNPEDLNKYPRTLEADIEILQNVNDKIIVYAPSVIDIYGDIVVATAFEYDGLELQMEGKFRPGHFDGVGTVVKKLFEIVQPKNAYFGEKDFQQLQIIKKMVAKHQMPVTIVGCPIYREDNGLAMSSRNQRLTDYEKQEAGFIYKILQEAKLKFKTQSVSTITTYIIQEIQKKPIFTLDYFEIAQEDTLTTCAEIDKEIDKHKKYRAFIAVFINNIRLIDNISLN